MITTILTIIVVVVLIKFLWPILSELFGWVFDILMLPLAVLGGFVGFLIEALLFVGALWLIVTIFGL